MPIAEATALATLGWVASPVVKDLVNKSTSYLGTDIAKGLDDLETTLLPQFQLTIQAAQQNPLDSIAPLTKWLDRLKNAYFDAEAILHDLEYKRLKRKVKREDKKLWVRLSSKPVIKFLVKKASLLSPQKIKLLKRLNKLKEVAAEAKNFRDLLDIQKTGIKDGLIARHNFHVTPLLLTHKVFGRDRDRNKIIKFLFDDGDRDGDHYSVVAITGMPGVGKTTLARYVCNNKRVNTYFPLIIWLSLSQNLNIIEHTKQMIEYASGKRPDLSNFSKLQKELVKALPDNVLVVLDDIWYDKNDGATEEKQWDNFLKPFASQGRTCKILVTSCSTSLPIVLRHAKLVQLHDLAHDAFISLLRYHAIDGLQIKNAQLKNDLGDIVDQIAQKMSKLPFAAKVVGKQLREQPNITFWRATLENVQCLKDTMEISLWSFYRLKVQLQRCFLFCSVFPKGTRYDLDFLLPYWVALDFIQPPNDNRSTVEDIGLEYFNNMVANSIFHKVDKKYIMQDLFHDLAEKLSAEDCFRVTNAERQIPPTVQHVFLEALNKQNPKENLSSICKLSNLRTLILGNQFIDDISEIIPKISKKKFRNLRVLDVWSRGYKKVPEVVGGFRNLRLLNFGMSSIEKLPNSVLQLYHLQFLRLPSSVKTLPTELCNLIKLRRIEMYNNDGAQVNALPPVPYLGKLTSLQGLDEFHVKKEEGYELKQLGSLKEIGGSLRIVNLENVIDKNEAIEAKLIEKHKLKKLELVWESAEINDLQIQVIEALEPPPDLKLLTIDGYRGSTYPTWLQEGSSIRYIKDVRFYNCNSLTNFPPNVDHFCQLSELIFQNLGALRDLSNFSENLDRLSRLSIINCPSLIFVCDNELQVNENQSTFEQFLRRSVQGCKHVLGRELKSFEQSGSVENCAQQLRIIKNVVRGNAPQTLSNVNVNRAWWYCHQQRMNFIFRFNTTASKNKLKLPHMLQTLHLGYCCVSDGALSDCLRGMNTLKELYLSGIMTITTLPPEQVLKSLEHLQVLEIKHCWYMRSLGGLHALPHLKRFQVEGCWCLDMPKELSVPVRSSSKPIIKPLAKFTGQVHISPKNNIKKDYLPVSFRSCTPLPPTLQAFIIRDCAVPRAILKGDLPCLQNVEISNCLVSRFLSFCQLTNLKSLALVHCPGLFSIKGLESRPFINVLHLVRLPNLVVESVRKSWQGCRQQLIISSSVMLNNLLSSDDFAPPQILGIECCQEEAISFEKSDHLQSIKKLVFNNCKTKNLPETLRDFSTLEIIDFIDCSEIPGLPELPDSIQRITIRGCPELQKRCQQNNGPDWHKIQRIQDIRIE